MPRVCGRLGGLAPPVFATPGGRLPGPRGRGGRPEPHREDPGPAPGGLPSHRGGRRRPGAPQKLHGQEQAQHGPEVPPRRERELQLRRRRDGGDDGQAHELAQGQAGAGVSCRPFADHARRGQGRGLAASGCVLADTAAALPPQPPAGHRAIQQGATIERRGDLRGGEDRVPGGARAQGAQPSAGRRAAGADRCRAMRRAAAGEPHGLSRHAHRPRLRAAR
mmetsp:Transcript_82153/g.255336  ORF Transcript_82153/g.255336 Transcript_82153/m.255336 type:complete len:221 (+) Transcript_82153:702-1364(+)